MTYLWFLILKYNLRYRQKLLAEKKVEYTDALNVISPIPHQGQIEKHPSAIYNFDKDTLWDFTLDKGFTSISACELLEGLPYVIAKKFVELFTQSIDYRPQFDWVAVQQHSIYKYFPKTLWRDLSLSLDHENGLRIPVIYYHKIIDIRNYNMHRKSAKMLSDVMHPTPTGLIIPFDLTVDLPKTKAIIICEGEKDMLIARAYGLNAICITGGAMRVPEYNNNFFVGRNFVIIYDNDTCGRTGSEKLANYLLEKNAKKIKIFDWTKIKNFKPQEKDDLFDFFIKYQQTVTDLQKIFREIPHFKQTAKPKVTVKALSQKKLVTLSEAKNIEKNFNQTCTSKIQVIANFTDVLAVPIKWQIEKATYEITFRNIDKILGLIGNETQQLKTMAEYLGVRGDVGLDLKVLKRQSVYQYEIFDFQSHVPETSILYTLGWKLQTGQKYQIDYKVLSHPKEQHKVVFFLKYVQDLEQEVNAFKLTETAKQNLKSFQIIDTVEAKMLQFYEDAKKYIGNYISKDVFYLNDLAFHSALEFKYNNQIFRGALDILMIGETRVGKSETSKYAIKLYEKGTILSLKNTSERGLIGGSTRSGTKGQGWKISIGALTQQHRNLIILEELQGCEYDPHQAMTDMRSSGFVRLTRAGASLHVPTLNRRLTISNPKASHLSIKQYSSGIPIIEALVPKREDIARYDLIGIVNAHENMIRPANKYQDTPRYPKSFYINRINWIWSRKPDQIIFSKETQNIIWEKTLVLHEKFGSNNQIIGRETNLKLTRVAIAVAGMVCSTDQQWEKILVHPEHVKWAYHFFDQLYSSPMFKLDQYVKKQKEIREMHPDDPKNFETLYKVINNQEILDNLATVDSFVNTKSLQLWSDYDQTELSIIIKELLNRKYIIPYKKDYIVTLRYKLIYENFAKQKNKNK